MFRVALTPRSGQRLYFHVIASPKPFDIPPSTVTGAYGT